MRSAAACKGKKINCHAVVRCHFNMWMKCQPLKLSSPLGTCDFAVIYLISHFDGTFKDKEKTICIFETQAEMQAESKEFQMDEMQAKSKEFQMAETQAKKLLVQVSPNASSGASFV